MGRFATAIACFLIASTPAAGEVIGTVTGTMNGKSWNWSVIQIEGAGATGTFSEIVPGFVSVTVQGQPGESFAVKDAISITFTLQQEALSDPAVSYFPEAGFTEYYEAEQSAVKITLEEKRSEPDGMFVAGTAQARLVHTKREGLDFVTNPADYLEVDVQFSSKLIEE